MPLSWQDSPMHCELLDESGNVVAYIAKSTSGSWGAFDARDPMNKLGTFPNPDSAKAFIALRNM